MSTSWIFRYLDCRLLMIVWYRLLCYPLLAARRLPPLADPSTPDPHDNEGFTQLTSHHTLSLYCLHKLLCFNTTVLIRGLSYNNRMTRTRWINNGSKNAVLSGTRKVCRTMKRSILTAVKGLKRKDFVGLYRMSRPG